MNALDQVTVSELLEHCRALSDRGWSRVVVDASAVTGCDRPGLLGLCELAQGQGGLEVTLTGIRWSQFLPALQATPLVELTATHHQIRAIIGDATEDHASSEPGPLPTQRGRHRRLPAAIKTRVG